MAEKSLIQTLLSKGLFLVTAESLTAGLVGAEITKTPGSSEVYLGGVIAYQNAVKEQLLGVSPALISNQGAVDAEVAVQMASGARSRFARANSIALDRVIALATTGVAGPGESEGKPAGTVFVAVSSSAGETVYAFSFEGSREQIREQSVEAAMGVLGEQLQLISG